MKNKSLAQLFLANFRIMMRGWRALFWNLGLPIGLYVALSVLHLTNIAGTAVSYADYLLPGIIAMTVMQTGIYTLAYWLIDLKQRGVLKRFMVTPISPAELVSSLITTRVILMVLQVAFLALVGSVFFGSHIRGSLIAILLLVLIGGPVFLSIGFLISTVAKSYDEAAPITTIVNLVMTALGNVFIPAAVFPRALQWLSKVLPLTYLSDGLRASFLGTAAPNELAKDFAALLLWLAVMFAATMYAFKKTTEL